MTLLKSSQKSDRVAAEHEITFDERHGETEKSGLLQSKMQQSTQDMF